MRDRVEQVVLMLELWVRTMYGGLMEENAVVGECLYTPSANACATQWPSHLVACSVTPAQVLAWAGSRIQMPLRAGTVCACARPRPLAFHAFTRHSPIEVGMPYFPAHFHARCI